MKRKRFLIGLAAVAFVIFAAYQEKQEEALQEEIADKILRFHVVANSDSDEDQEVKLLVRDAVGELLAPKLSGAESRAETEAIVQENLDAVVETAQQTLSANGYSYGAAAELKSEEFPDRTYGAYTFPAGTYRTLLVTLGSGQGHNWWCVLYPNMCFQGSVYEITEDSKKALQQVLTQEEYADIFRAGNFRIRLKILDYFS